MTFKTILAVIGARDAATDVDKAIAAASKAGRKSVLVQLRHGDNNRFVALPIAEG